MHFYPPISPVINPRTSQEALNVRLLHDYCDLMSAKLSELATEVTIVRADLANEMSQNHKLKAFTAWLLETNPQVLDEYKLTNAVLAKLDPPDTDTAYAQAQ